MLKMMPYKPADLAQIEPREYEQTLDRYASYDYSETFALGPAYTLFDDERPVMAGGVVPHWRTRGEAWLRLSPWVKKHPLAAFKWIRMMFQTIQLMYPEMKRIEAPVSATRAENMRLVRHLGFQHESLMQKWGPEGDDYVMTVVIR